jgi:hypothetical protein
VPVNYEFELKQDGEVIATGRMRWDKPLAVGDRVTIGPHAGSVTQLMPALPGRDPRAIVAI